MVKVSFFKKQNKIEAQMSSKQPQLKLPELLDLDKNHLPKPHVVQCELGTRWGFCRPAACRYRSTDIAHLWLPSWRLMDGTSVVASDSFVWEIEGRGETSSAACHTRPPAPPHPPFVFTVIYSETARMSSHGLLYPNEQVNGPRIPCTTQQACMFLNLNLWEADEFYVFFVASLHGKETYFLQTKYMVKWNLLSVDTFY